MNASLSYETQMSKPNIDFALTKDQEQLTRIALEVATGKDPNTNAFTVEDVARATILLNGSGLLDFFNDSPDFSSDEDLNRQVTNYLDGVAELDRLVGSLLSRDGFEPISGGGEVKRIVLGDVVTIKD